MGEGCDSNCSINARLYYQPCMKLVFLGWFCKKNGSTPETEWTAQRTTGMINQPYVHIPEEWPMCNLISLVVLVCFRQADGKTFGLLVKCCVYRVMPVFYIYHYNTARYLFVFPIRKSSSVYWSYTRLVLPYTRLPCGASPVRLFWLAVTRSCFECIANLNHSYTS